MTAPRPHAELAARYFADVTLKCWARDKDSNDKWDLLHSPLFISQDVEYYVGHEPPPPIKRTINLPAAAIELRPGEQYAGLVLKDDGTPSHHLVWMTEQNAKDLSWDYAKDWALKVGGEPPTLRELSLIYAHCRAHVKHVWYWSGEEFKDDTESAWGYHFGEGYHNIHPKYFEANVIAVRHIPIGGRDE